MARSFRPFHISFSPGIPSIPTIFPPRRKQFITIRRDFPFFSSPSFIIVPFFYNSVYIPTFEDPRRSQSRWGRYKQFQTKLDKINSFNSFEASRGKVEKAKIRINFDPAERHWLYLCSTRVTASIASPWKKERKKGGRSRENLFREDIAAIFNRGRTWFKLDSLKRRSGCVTFAFRFAGLNNIWTRTVCAWNRAGSVNLKA